jgi:hypothetical protein
MHSSFVFAEDVLCTQQVAMNRALCDRKRVPKFKNWAGNCFCTFTSEPNRTSYISLSGCFEELQLITELT